MSLLFRKWKLSFFSWYCLASSKTTTSFWKLGAAVLSFELLNEILCILDSLPFLSKLVNACFSWVMSTSWPCGPLCTANGLNHRGIQLHSPLLTANSSGNNKYKTPLFRPWKKKNHLLLFSKSFFLSPPFILLHGSKKEKNSFTFSYTARAYFSQFKILPAFRYISSSVISHDFAILHRIRRFLNFTFQG